MGKTWASRYSIAASTLALLFAMGGTAYAVNTVRSADIVDGTIKTADLGTNSVQSPDIKNGTVTTADVAASSLGRSPRIAVQVFGDGQPGNITMGLAGTEHIDTGEYEIGFTRDLLGCAVQITPFDAVVVANYSFAFASVDTLAVHVVDLDGVPTDAAFDIVAVC